MRFLLDPSYSTVAAYVFEICFFVLFIGLIANVYSRRRAQTYKRLEQLPFECDQ